jgi:hypothetical protein
VAEGEGRGRAKGGGVSPLLALALALGTPVQAAPAPAPAPPAARAEQPREAALALVRVLNSEAMVVGDAGTDAKAHELMRQLSQGNKQLAELETGHPGILRALADAMLPIVNRSARERLPQLWQRQARLYGDSFTDAELAKLTAFYTSPTGRKLITTMQSSMKTDAMMAEASRTPGFKVSPEAVAKDVAATTPALMGRMDGTDHLQLMALAQTGLLDRLKAVGPKSQAISLAWYDESAPWEEAETDRAIDAVLKKYGIGDE